MLALQVNSLAVHLDAYNTDITVFDNQLILSLEMLAQQPQAAGEVKADKKK